MTPEDTATYKKKRTANSYLGLDFGPLVEEGVKRVALPTVRVGGLVEPLVHSLTKGETKRPMAVEFEQEKGEEKETLFALSVFPPPPTFFQPQSGGLCRMHAINAYLGAPYIAVPVFRFYCDVFDDEHGQPRGTTHNAGTVYFEDCGAYEDSCNNVLSFILKKVAGVETLLLPHSADPASDLDAEARALGVTSALSFTASHVWYSRLTERGWYRVDSMGGIRRAPPPSSKKHGHLMILDGGVLPSLETVSLPGWEGVK